MDLDPVYSNRIRGSGSSKTETGSATLLVPEYTSRWRPTCEQCCESGSAFYGSKPIFWQNRIREKHDPDLGIKWTRSETLYWGNYKSSFLHQKKDFLNTHLKLKYLYINILILMFFSYYRFLVLDSRFIQTTEFLHLGSNGK